MEIDENRIDEAVLALFYLTLDRSGRVWKGFQWEAMDRLHAKGMIGNPIGKAKSVVLTDEGITQSEHLFREMFTKPGLIPEPRCRVSILRAGIPDAGQLELPPLALARGLPSSVLIAKFRRSGL